MTNVPIPRVPDASAPGSELRRPSGGSVLLRLEAVVDRAAYALAFAFLAVAVVDMARSNSQSGIDFAVFYRAGGRFLLGEDLYSLSDGHFAYKYAPPVALLFAPFRLLPERLGWTAWNLVSAFGLVRLMRFSAAAQPVRHGLASHVAVLLVVMPFYTHLFALGQSDAVILALVVASEERCERPALSGALLGAACLFKPPFVLVGLLAAVRRQGGRLAFAAGAVAAGFGLTALRYGLSGAAHQVLAWKSLLGTSTPGLLCDPQNQSAYALACTYVATPSSGVRFAVAVGVLGLTVTLALAAAVAVIRSHDRQAGRFAAFAALLFLAAFLSPLGWRTNLLGSIPLLYLLLSVVRGGAPGPRWSAALAFMGLLVVGNLNDRFLGKDPYGFLLAHRHFGLMGVVAALSGLGAAAWASRRLHDAGARV